MKTFVELKGIVKKSLGTSVLDYLLDDEPAITKDGKKQAKELQSTRLAVVAEVIELLGDNYMQPEQMRVWLLSPNPDLENSAPLKYLKTVNEPYKAVLAAFEANVGRVLVETGRTAKVAPDEQRAASAEPNIIEHGEGSNQ